MRMLQRLLEHPLRLVLGVAIALFLLYELSAQLFAYTGDAYATSDVVIVSSEVGGPIASIFVDADQTVSAGDRLFAVDSSALKLAVAGAEARLERARAGLALASAEATGGGAAQHITEQHMAVARADVAVAEAALATARDRLAKAEVSAPATGRIARFVRLRGDVLPPGAEVMAIVTPDHPRIVANIAERHLSHLRIGQEAFVTIGSQPWRMMRGHVSGIAAGIARSDTQQPILPYVEPTTDWVRLPRRFPVEITLDDLPPGTAPPLGVDARVLIRF